MSARVQSCLQPRSTAKGGSATEAVGRSRSLTECPLATTVDRRSRPIAVLIAAVASVSVTAALLATVVSFAEPQRSTLIAKAAAAHGLAAAQAAVILADAR